MVEIDSSLEKEQTISRYMSFAKFLDLLKKRRLYFSSLASLSDPHEGSSTLLNMIFDTGVADALDAVVNYSMVASLGIGISKEEKARLREEGERRLASRNTLTTVFGDFLITDNERYKKILMGQRLWTDVSCWHKSEDESLAMWQTYGGSNESIAVKSTIARLADAVKPADLESMMLSSVHYIDHQRQHFQSQHVLAPAIHKQLPYSYEQEVRAIVWNSKSDIFQALDKGGRYIAVDLKQLVSGLRISPKAAPWFKELIKIETDGELDVPIERSALDRVPIFG